MRLHPLRMPEAMETRRDPATRARGPRGGGAARGEEVGDDPRALPDRHPSRPVQPAQGLDPGPYFQPPTPSPDLSRVLVVGFGTAHAVRAPRRRIGPGPRIVRRLRRSWAGRRGSSSPTAGPSSPSRSRTGAGSSSSRPTGPASPRSRCPRARRRSGSGPSRAKGLLAVGVSATRTRGEWTGDLVDLEPGSFGPSRSSRSPAPSGSTLSVPPPGSPATRLALRRDRRVVLYDPATGDTDAPHARLAGRQVRSAR